MILPIKLYITEDSFLMLYINIPLWITFRNGFKPDSVVKDRWFAPYITCMTGKDVSCLHAYVLHFGFRIRSNKKMNELERGSKRFLFSRHMGWGQVFESAII